MKSKMHRPKAVVAVAVVSLALGVTGLVSAVPTEMDFSIASSTDEAFTSTTDAYATFITDTCTQQRGFVVYLDEEVALAKGLHPTPTGLSGFDSGKVILKVGPEDPCCVCGIIYPDATVRGCVALEAPCCCQFYLQPDGTIYCTCQGGQGCSIGG